MLRKRVKICGICRPEDAQDAAMLGADAIGMVFDPNAGRCITIEQAKQIVAELPAMMTSVGLFVNQPAEYIRQVFQSVPLACVQLHGDETPEFAAQLAPIPIIKALHVKPDNTGSLESWKRANQCREITNVRGFVLDTPSTSAPGGTGIANDFEGLRQMLEAGVFDGLQMDRLIIAGGLNPQNVKGVIQLLYAAAVDVSSGVEEVRREKSFEKMKSFIQAVRSTDSI